MPLPDFSELTFGFAFLREFERRYTRGGSFPAAPDFITQAEEANKGYDVGVLNGATPVYFQFKRSFVVRTTRATEFQSQNPFQGVPLYRMHLMRKQAYRQHTALQALESAGHDVLYVTSQVPTPAALNRAFLDQRIVEDASALFAPNDISLPNTTSQHWVSFEADASFGVIYSREGRKFERNVRSAGQLADTRLVERLGDVQTNLKRLNAVVEAASQLNRPLAARIKRRFSNPIARASVIAASILDAQLTFFHEL